MLRSARLASAIARRAYSTEAATREGWLYVDSVFPIQIASWDFRHYVGILREDNLLSTLETRLEQLSHIHNFKPLELQSHRKDGGVFVRFSYTPPEEPQIDEEKQRLTMENELREALEKRGGVPTWLGVNRGTIWGQLYVVRGSPWREDMNRYASHFLKIAFDGPDIQEQTLYELCRPYGPIKDISPPAPVPAGTLRSATVTYRQLHSATVARNVIHGLDVGPNTASSSSTPASKTRLRTQYQQAIQTHAIRDWMSSHPRIVLPIIFFLLGTLTYTVFDPIRALMVEAKMLDWFDYRKFRLYQWLRLNTLDRLSNTFGVARAAASAKAEEVWKEREDAESALKAYLADTPSTIAFVHGPQGSGKTSMLELVLKESGRNNLVIDVRALNGAGNDTALISNLAAQTGYWPVFTFLNSMNSLIDLASVGLIGQKTGMSSSVPEQLKQILSVVTDALKGVSSSYRASIQRQVKQQQLIELRHAQDLHKRQAIRDGTWHDGRIDCIAGNGVMSELGIGDERFGEDVVVVKVPEDEELREEAEEKELAVRRQKSKEDAEAVSSLPIVIIKNFSSTGSASVEDMLGVLSQWAAALVENQIAHVIVLSDNRENVKRIAKAMPSKPLNSIALSDADSASSLSFVKQKLHDSGIEVGISGDQARTLERLGGRASDLESLIHKVRSGMKVDEAVEDIISRGVAELRKNAFGDDADDAKSLPWTREQAWRVLKVLSKSAEVGYYDMLIEFPFKGDETALRNMEHAELIAINTKDGRPSTIRPGKPVFRYVFERVVNDKVFQATQELAYNEKQISEAETKIKAYEQELSLLVETMKSEGRRWWQFGHSACRERARYIGDKLVTAERKVEGLERKNNDLKRVLAKA